MALWFPVRIRTIHGFFCTLKISVMGFPESLQGLAIPRNSAGTTTTAVDAVSSSPTSVVVATPIISGLHRNVEHGVFRDRAARGGHEFPHRPLASTRWVMTGETEVKGFDSQTYGW